MDPGTGITLAVPAAWLADKILGPTAGYLGEGLKLWTQRRLENVGRIFSHAQIKLGDLVNTEGSVPPRVLRGILTEGSFCDNELALNQARFM